MTRAPRAQPSSSAESPMPPVPCTASHSPACSAARSVSACQTVVTRHPSPAATTGVRLSGRRARLWAKGTEISSAKAPGSVNPGRRWRAQVLPWPDWQSGQTPQARMKGATTRSPTFHVDCGPVSTTSPQYSCPGIWPGFTRGCSPVQPCQSDRQMPQASTRSTTPSASHAGSAAFSSDRSSL